MFSVTAAKTLNAARACGSTDRRASAGPRGVSLLRIRSMQKIQNLFYVLRKVQMGGNEQRRRNICHIQVTLRVFFLLDLRWKCLLKENLQIPAK